MYESPITLTEVTNKVLENVQKAHEEFVYNTILNIGIDVNRDELVKALNYDRQQYEKGYSDAKETTRNISGRNPIDKFVCEKCGFMVDGWTAFNYEDETDDRFDYEFAFKYCPDCGRKVER